MEEVRKAFDAGAYQYDTQRRLIIPDFTGFYRAALWAAEIPPLRKSPAILDIGAGTGILSELMVQRYPGAIITLLDISENMLELAKRRFQARANIHFIIADYSREDFGKEYDIICSALSIHHLTNVNKRGLYRRIFEALNRGGLFINADQVQGESEWMHQRNLEYWDEFIMHAGLPRKEAEAVLSRRDRYDRMEKLSVQLRWLREAGFSDMELVYKNRPFVVFLGRKA